MKNIFIKTIALTLSFIIAFPSVSFANKNKSQTDIAKMISSVFDNEDSAKKALLALFCLSGGAVAGYGAVKKIKANNAKAAIYKDPLVSEVKARFEADLKRSRGGSFESVQNVITGQYKRRTNQLNKQLENVESLSEQKISKIMEEKITVQRKMDIALSMDIDVSGKVMYKERTVTGKFIDDIASMVAYDAGGKKKLAVKTSNLLKRLNVDIKEVSLAKEPSAQALARTKALQTVEEISALPSSSAYVEKRLSEIVRVARENIRGKGGVAGIAVVAVLSAVWALSSSTEENVKLVSNNRLAIERELKETFKKNPDLLSAKVAILKDIYGLQAVSSVIYENQYSMLPVLEKQIKIISNPHVQKISRQMITRGDLAENSYSDNGQAFDDLGGGLNKDFGTV